MFKLKYGYMPAHWGLKGRSREIAKAEYELVGFDLEKRLIEINSEDFSLDEVARKFIELDFKYNKITKSEYYRSLTDLIKDEKQKTLAILELDHNEKKISDMDYEKQTATLNGEPWVYVLNMDFGGTKSLEGSFELDWNEYFVKKLETEGYTGHSPDATVNAWFMEVCRNVALEEFDGTGDFTADSEANLEAVKRWNAESKPLSDGRKDYK